MEPGFATSGFSDALVILGAAGIVIPGIRADANHAGHRVHPGRHASSAHSGSARSPASIPWLHLCYDQRRAPRSNRSPSSASSCCCSRSGLDYQLPAIVEHAPGGVRRRRAELIGCAMLIGGGLLRERVDGIPGASALGLALALSSTALVLPIVGTEGAVGKTALRDAAVRGPGAGPDRLPARLDGAPAAKPAARCSARCCIGGCSSSSAMLFVGRVCARRSVRPGRADQEPRAVPGAQPAGRDRRQPGDRRASAFRRCSAR